MWAVPPALVALGLISVALHAQSPQPIFRAQTTIIPVYATVSGADGRLVPDLTRDDFEVVVDGQPREIVAFSRDSVPVTLAAMIDLSGSIRQPQTHQFAQDYFVKRIRLAADRLLGDLHADDRACIGLFAGRVGISQIISGDKRPLLAALDDKSDEQGNTPLWQAIDIAMTSLSGEGGRRIVVAFTDGVDNVSPRPHAPAARTVDTTAPSLDDVVRHAQRDNFMLYAVGFEGLAFDPQIELFAGDTGGGYVVVHKTDDPSAVMARVADELHHQYLLGFVPATLDGKTHGITVRVKAGGMKARARRSFVAVATSPIK